MLEITGTKGSLVLDLLHSTLHQHQDGKQITTRLPHPPDEGERYHQNVCDHLVKGRPLVITAEWSRRPIHILDLAALSAATGRALPAKYP
jgi:predicted dehydrogenase